MLVLPIYSNHQVHTYIVFPWAKVFFKISILILFEKERIFLLELVVYGSKALVWIVLKFAYRGWLINRNR
jgi:hypothetical protein